VDEDVDVQNVERGGLEGTEQYRSAAGYEMVMGPVTRWIIQPVD